MWKLVEDLANSFQQCFTFFQVIMPRKKPWPSVVDSSALSNNVKYGFLGFMRTTTLRKTQVKWTTVKLRYIASKITIWLIVSRTHPSSLSPHWPPEYCMYFYFFLLLLLDGCIWCPKQGIVLILWCFLVVSQHNILPNYAHWIICVFVILSCKRRQGSFTPNY